MIDTENSEIVYDVWSSAPVPQEWVPRWLSGMLASRTS